MILDRFNPRAPRGARLLLRLTPLAILEVSIHAPRVGRDMASRKKRKLAWEFQSTRPAWGAT